MSQEIFLEKIPHVLRVEELAKVLCIGRNAAYELLRSGKIRSVRIGKCYLIPREALIKFLLNDLNPID